MALFKVYRGNENNLPTSMNDGYAYFCTDTGNFYIDWDDGNGVLSRTKINAGSAYSLRYMNGEEYVEVSASDISHAVSIAHEHINKSVIDGITNDSIAKWNWSVLYTPQDLTDEQKAQARENIGVNSEIADTLLSLNIINPIYDDDGSLAEDDGTLLIVRNDDIFLPEVTDENNGGVLTVENGKWTIGAVDIPEVNYPVTSVDGMTGDIVLESTYETKTDAQAKLVESKEYTDTAIANLVNSAPETLDTLGELATAFKENADVVDALDAAIANKADKSELFGGSWNDLSDKPFYEEERIETALIENASGSWLKGERPAIQLNPSITLVDGTTYKIVIESTIKGNTATETIEVVASDGVCLFPVQGYGWYLGNEACGSWENSYTAMGSIGSLSVYEVEGGGVKCLDEKFIPDTIARATDIPQMPDINYPVTSVNGMTGDVQIEIPEGFSGSWNDLTDKPFYEDGNGATITWDGDTEGRESVALTLYGTDYTYYKISDLTPAESDVIGGVAEANNGNTMDITESLIIDVSDIADSYTVANVILVIKSDSSDYQHGIYFANLNGSYMTRLTYGSITIKTIDEKFIPDTISRFDGDWESLTNKPFYKQIESTSIVKSAIRTYENVGDGIYFTVADMEWQPIVGESYTIRAGGKAGRNLICKEAPSTYSYMFTSYCGNLSMFEPSEENTSESVLAVFNAEGDGVAYLITTGSSDSSIASSVSGNAYVYYPIDERYIPDTIARKEDALVISDWGQNDWSAKDYIKNRTHWLESGIQLTEEPIELNFSEVNEEGNMHITSIPNLPDFDSSKTYTIFWNGVRYEVVSQRASWSNLDDASVPTYGDDILIGNLDLSSDDSNYTSSPTNKYPDLPFLIYRGFTSTGSVSYNGAYLQGAEPCTVEVEIYEGVHLYHTLDERYIPDTIARAKDVPEVNYPVTSVNGMTGDVVIEVPTVPDAVVNPTNASVGQTIVVKAVDENGKPTVWEAVDPWVITSSTEGSAKQFKLSIDDNGVLITTEIVESAT